ncbi:inactive serine/threonine-protein kinase TEX14 isoform X1 [Protopterus annectens]|uniref:inactive serine/threonine-protein kinase TEX14 isoform X1 n=1 Tax=Protopterus annectens TaxID=7888 RepID=UPI001CF9BD9F|nr:inactive serine/threonine-protein kinase TEX14 isoform X1 [Protopterus annectens]
MKAFIQRTACDDICKVGSSPQKLVQNPSLLQAIKQGNPDMQLSRMCKCGTFSSKAVCCFGYGKLCITGMKRTSYLASVPVITEKELLQADDEASSSYANGPYMRMTPLIWNGNRVTVKELIPPTHLNCSKLRLGDLIIAEQQYASKLRHFHVMLLMAICLSHDMERTQLVYERVYLGSLYSILHEKRSEFPLLRLETIVSVLLQINDALIYLHSQGYIHRTLTSYAVQLVTTDVAKISNFEFMVESKDGGVHSDLTRIPVPVQFYNWVSPEVIRGKSATFKSDVYSFCTVIQEVFTETVPWFGVDGSVIKNILSSGRGLEVDARVPKPYYDIVRMGVQVKHQDRCINLQDIRYIIRNDIKDLTARQQEHTDEGIKGESKLYPNMNTDLGYMSVKPFGEEEIQSEKREYKTDSPHYAFNSHVKYTNDQIKTVVKTWSDDESQHEMVLKEQECCRDTKSFKSQNPFSSLDNRNKVSVSNLAEGQSKDVGAQADILEHLKELDSALEFELRKHETEEYTDTNESLLNQDRRSSNISEGESSFSDTVTYYTSENEAVSENENVVVGPKENRQSEISVDIKNSEEFMEKNKFGTVEQAISSCVLNLKVSQTLLQQAEDSLCNAEQILDGSMNALSKDSERFEKTTFEMKTSVAQDVVDSCNNSRRKEKSNISVALGPPQQHYMSPGHHTQRVHSASDCKHFPALSGDMRQTPSEQIICCVRENIGEGDDDESDYSSNSFASLSTRHSQGVKVKASVRERNWDDVQYCNVKGTVVADNESVEMTARLQSSIPKISSQTWAKKMNSVWADEVTEVVEKLVSGQLNVGAKEMEEDENVYSESDAAQSFFSQFPNRSQQERKSKRHYKGSSTTSPESEEPQWQNRGQHQEMLKYEQHMFGYSSDMENSFPGIKGHSLENVGRFMEQSINETFITARAASQSNSISKSESESEIMQDFGKRKENSCILDISGRNVVFNWPSVKDSGDRSGIHTLGFTPFISSVDVPKVDDLTTKNCQNADTSLVDIQDLSSIPREKEAAVGKLACKTPHARHAVSRISTPRSPERNVTTYKKTSSEAVLPLNRLLDTTIWESSDSAMTSLGSFATAYDTSGMLRTQSKASSSGFSESLSTCRYVSGAMQSPCPEPESVVRTCPFVYTPQDIGQAKDPGQTNNDMGKQQQTDNAVNSSLHYSGIYSQFDETERAHSTLDAALEAILSTGNGILSDIWENQDILKETLRKEDPEDEEESTVRSTYQEAKCTELKYNNDVKQAVGTGAKVSFGIDISDSKISICEVAENGKQYERNEDVPVSADRNSERVTEGSSYQGKLSADNIKVKEDAKNMCKEYSPACVLPESSDISIYHEARSPKEEDDTEAVSDNLKCVTLQKRHWNQPHRVIILDQANSPKRL